MIYALGDSFTKWHWFTWADWMSHYLKSPVKNLAYPGLTNDAIYWSLINLQPKLTAQDKVYIMWTGTNRVCQWYDAEYVQTRELSNFFPDTKGKLWFGENYRGLYKTHPDHLPSMTHMIVSTIDTIFKSQMLLNNIGCEYVMMFWQNPWADTREIFVPNFQATWPSKPGKLTKIESINAEEILSMPVIKNIMSQINWNKFIGVPNPNDAKNYQGLWEFTLKNPELVLNKHQTDNHPNVLAQHDWYTEMIAPETNPVHRSQAQDQAKQFINYALPDLDYRTLGVQAITEQN